MDKFGKSQPVIRREDVRFLTGQGRYVDDIAPEGALFAYVFRSPVAHATVTSLDVEEARGSEGVHAVLTAQSLLDAGIDFAMAGAAAPNRDGTKGATPRRALLAEDKLRFVGEPAAFIVAETLDQARDAAELIELDYDDLPAKLDIEAGGPAIHDDVPDNRAFDWGMGDEAATDAAFKAAAKTVSLEVPDNRIIVNSLEPRGCFAEWEDGRVHVSLGGQGVWVHKNELARAFGLDPSNVRVTNPDVGGGFGMKGFPYPEYFLAAQAAREIGRPVRWMSDRTEAMLTDNAGRDLTSLAEFAFDENNKITAYRVHTKSNLGAYNSHFGQFIQSQLFSRVLMGVYDVQTTWLRV